MSEPTARWCPTCGVTVTLDWHTDELTSWDVHDACGTALVDPREYDAEASHG